MNAHFEWNICARVGECPDGSSTSSYVVGKSDCSSYGKDADYDVAAEEDGLLSIQDEDGRVFMTGLPYREDREEAEAESTSSPET